MWAEICIKDRYIYIYIYIYIYTYIYLSKRRTKARFLLDVNAPHVYTFSKIEQAECLRAPHITQKSMAKNQNSVGPSNSLGIPIC